MLSATLGHYAGLKPLTPSTSPEAPASEVSVTASLPLGAPAANLSTAAKIRSELESAHAEQPDDSPDLTQPAPVFAADRPPLPFANAPRKARLQEYPRAQIPVTPSAPAVAPTQATVSSLLLPDETSVGSAMKKQRGAPMIVAGVAILLLLLVIVGLVQRATAPTGIPTAPTSTAE